MLKGFWGYETLKERLQHLIGDDKFDAKKIDCAAYTLSIGAEVFVTGDASADDAKSRAKLTLLKGEPFTIPPGQFALILTEECVEIPADVLAFISMKTTYKLKGLVNVSGFHVDPGWNGYLTFGVYNAGPSHVHLHRGQDMFLIWFASLDRPNEPEHLYRGDKNTKPVLPPKWLASMSGDVFSPMRLKDDMVRLEKDFASRVDAVRTDIGRVDSWLQLFRFITIPLLVAAVLALTPMVFRVAYEQWAMTLRSFGVLDPAPVQPSGAAAAPAATPAASPAATAPAVAPPVAPAANAAAGAPPATPAATAPAGAPPAGGATTPASNATQTPPRPNNAPPTANQ